MSAADAGFGHHVCVEISRLVGAFVVEVGVRQAWPFVGFCNNEAAAPTEWRLYLDTEWSTDAEPGSEASDETRWLLAAAALNGSTVAEAEVGAGGTLHIKTTDGHWLVASGEPNDPPSGEPWWFSA